MVPWKAITVWQDQLNIRDAKTRRSSPRRRPVFREPQRTDLEKLNLLYNHRAEFVLADIKPKGILFEISG